MPYGLAFPLAADQGVGLARLEVDPSVGLGVLENHKEVLVTLQLTEATTVKLCFLLRTEATDAQDDGLVGIPTHHPVALGILHLVDRAAPNEQDAERRGTTERTLLRCRGLVLAGFVGHGISFLLLAGIPPWLLHAAKV